MVSIYSFGKPLSLPDIDEDTDGEDVGIYLEAACNKCHKYAKSIEAMTEQVDNLQSLLSHREHHLKVIKMRAKRANFPSKNPNILQYLQDAADFMRQKTEHQDLALAEMRKYREIVLKELSKTRENLQKALTENSKLKEENEKLGNGFDQYAPKKVKIIPPPPPPPPPSLLRFLPWKSGKTRSKSMSRIECRRKPMLLNDDILDQIRNKKYSLRKVEPPELGPLKVVTVDGTSDATRMLTHLIERRARMEYSDTEDDEDDTISRNFEY